MPSLHSWRVPTDWSMSSACSQFAVSFFATISAQSIALSPSNDSVPPDWLFQVEQLSGASATGSPRLATYSRGSCLLVFETVILRPELRRPPAEMHRRDHYVLSRHLPASSALFAASLRQVAAISPALPLANRAAAAATVVVNRQATGSRQKKKAKRDGKRTAYVWSATSQVNT